MPNYINLHANLKYYKALSSVANTIYLTWILVQYNIGLRRPDSADGGRLTCPALAPGAQESYIVLD